MEISSNEPHILTGGYEGKPQLLDVINKFNIGLKMIAYIHYRGTRKYPAFGWYNAPASCGGTIRDNLNAMLRHLGAHSLGFLKDVEGCLHVFHMACRAGMTVSVFYKDLSHTPWGLASSVSEYSASDWAKFITNEEILSLTKFYDHERNTTLEEKQAEILPAIVRAAEYLENEKRILPREDARFNKFSVSPFDELFFATIDFAQEFWKIYGNSNYIDEDHEDWKMLFTQTYEKELPDITPHADVASSEKVAEPWKFS